MSLPPLAIIGIVIGSGLAIGALMFLYQWFKAYGY